MSSRLLYSRLLYSRLLYSRLLYSMLLYSRLLYSRLYSRLLYSLVAGTSQHVQYARQPDSCNVCALQLFSLFLMHAYGARLWTGKSSQHYTPGYQTPALTHSLMYMDAPWRLQWPCLVPWVIGQAITSVAWLRSAVSSMWLHLFALRSHILKPSHL